jgi:hypothetical protein
MGVTHPSKGLARKEWKAAFFAFGERLVSQVVLGPVQGVPNLPVFTCSGGVVIATSFLLIPSYTQIKHNTLNFANEIDRAGDQKI